MPIGATPQYRKETLSTNPCSELVESSLCWQLIKATVGGMSIMDSHVVPTRKGTTSSRGSVYTTPISSDQGWADSWAAFRDMHSARSLASTCMPDR